MIRADWTPLWAADASTCKPLGRKQLACLQLLRDRGPLTRAELREAGISLSTLDKLSLTFAGSCYPWLVDLDGKRPQWYFLAAPRQQAELDAALAIVAAHPDGITWTQLCELQHQAGARTPDATVFHIYGAGLARYWSEGRGPSGQHLYPAAPGEQEQLMKSWARKTARLMAVPPRVNEVSTSP